MESVRLHPWLSYWIGAICSLLALYALALTRARLQPSNWLMKINRQTITIKFRSYLNAHFDPNDIQVFEIPLSHIQSARRVTEEIQLPHGFDSDGSKPNMKNEYLELTLKEEDTSRLATYLQEERLKKGPKQGSTRSWTQHYPVRLSSDRLIFIECKEIAPGIKVALELLGTQLSIGAEESLTIDLNNYRDKSDGEKEAKVLQLAQMGSTVQAIGLAKMFFNLDTVQAKKRVETLQSSK